MGKTITIIVPNSGMTVGDLTDMFSIVDTTTFNAMMMYSDTPLIEGQAFEIPVDHIQGSIPPEMSLPEVVEEPSSPYLYADHFAEEGLGAEIDASILENARESIRKQEALATAVAYHGTGVENPALHAFYADIQNRYTFTSFDAVEKDYQVAVLSSLMQLYISSDEQIDLSLLSEAIDFQEGAIDGSLDGLVEYYYRLKWETEDHSNNDINPNNWLLSTVDTIDLATVQSLLIEQIMLSQDSDLAEELNHATGLLEDYAYAIELDENYQDLLHQAIADVEAWDGEAEQQLLDTLWSEIATMHGTGGFVNNVDVRPIIGAFERYHEAMTARQTTMTHMADLREQFAYLNMSDDEKLDFHKQQKARDYLDSNGIDYDLDATIDQLIDLIMADLRAHPERTEYWLSSGFNLSSESLFGKADEESLLAQQEALIGALNRDAELLMTQEQREFIAGVALFFAGFVPLVGTAVDVLDFVISLARRDVAGAVMSLIPVIGDVAGGFRRIARKGRSLNQELKNIPNVPDITDYTKRIDELEDVIRKIDDQKSLLRSKKPLGDIEYTDNELLDSTFQHNEGAFKDLANKNNVNINLISQSELVGRYKNKTFDARVSYEFDPDTGELLITVHVHKDTTYLGMLHELIHADQIRHLNELGVLKLLDTLGREERQVILDVMEVQPRLFEYQLAIAENLSSSFITFAENKLATYLFKAEVRGEGFYNASSTIRKILDGLFTNADYNQNETLQYLADKIRGLKWIE